MPEGRIVGQPSGMRFGESPSDVECVDRRKRLVVERINVRNFCAQGSQRVEVFWVVELER